MSDIKDYHIVTTQGDDCWYTATVVEIPGVSGYGLTQEMAISNAYDSLDDHISFRKELGLSVPEPNFE